MNIDINNNQKYFLNIKILLIVIFIGIISYWVKIFMNEITKEVEKLNTLILDKNLIQNQNEQFKIDELWEAGENEFFKVNYEESIVRI